MGATWTTLAATAPGAGPDGIAGTFGLWALFSQSFDLFTVVLIVASMAGIALIVRCALEIRERRILPPARTVILRELAERGRVGPLRDEVEDDQTFLGRTLRAALSGRSPGGMRENAELTASEECARLFRTIEPLNIIGNLGPLVGLAGTVWGMILAFTSLGETGGQAGAADLSLGISKALFHTLLGLLLAIPCLLAYGLFRAVVDRICNRGMILAGQLIDLLETSGSPASSPGSPGSTGNGPAPGRPATPSALEAR